MRKKFPVFMVLAITTILTSWMFLLSSVWSNSEESIHLRVSGVYYLALGVIYILAFKKCKNIYRYIYVYPIAFLLQISCFMRLKYTVITYYSTMFYDIPASAYFINYTVIINIIMLIGFIQYFDILNKITEIEKYEMGFKTWTS